MTKKIICTLLTLLMLLPIIPMLATDAAASSVTIDDIIRAAAPVVRENEGYYHSVNANDNGALSIGWIQWHANRALNLLRTIVEANPTQAKDILGDSLYNEINTAQSWSTRILNEDEARRISSLISTDEGKKAQDDLAATDISSYINRAMALGITDPSALVYYADIENQCGSGGAKRVVQAAAAMAGSYDKITLDIIYKAALNDSIAGRYTTRRQKTYNNCLLLDWSVIGTDLEVWDIKAARNVRKTSDPASELVTSLTKGTMVIISEKAYVKGETRGRTSMGWITLDSASCSLNESLSGGTVPAPLIFDLNGGTFGPAPTASRPVNGVNTSRGANSLILYNSSYAYKAPQTNAYGAEVAVDKNGNVISSPAYGTCKTPIPEGGFVLSGIGSGYTWLSQNVKVGNYLVFNSERCAIYVYESYSAYTAIKKADGKATAINTPRGANSLVIYDKSYGHSAPQTNEYGAEAAIDKNGKVISAPYYGTCKTPIPEGGFVLSGIGSGYTWLSQNVRAGDYIRIDRASLTITVYPDQNRYLSAIKTTEKGHEYGTLPTPSKAGTEFLGWTISGTDTVVSEDTSCISPYTVTLKASWEKFAGHPVSYDTAGGSFTGTKAGMAGGLNISRPQNSIIVYDSSYGFSEPQTNAFGTEVAVDKNGAVLSAPVYGSCKTPIPKGGFVLSGIGSGYDWIMANITKNSYVSYDKSTGVITVYANGTAYEAINKKVLPGAAIGALPEVTKKYHKLVGWYTENGAKVTESYVMPSEGISLTAKWEVLPGDLYFNAEGGSVSGLISSVKLSGTNVSRGANSLVLYKDRASTGTNAYGCEAVISNDGTVLAVYPYGYGNSHVPKNGYVLSGIGTMYTWIQNNLKPGLYVVIEDDTVYVWESSDALKASNTVTVKFGEKYGPLPKASKEGYVFMGWKDTNGNIATEGGTVGLYGDVTLTAVWKKLCTVSFAPEGGTMITTGARATASGINVSRGSNALVIYAGKDTTGTNVYGSEAVIDKNGTVIAVYPYGRGNAQIPAGCIVLSGNGTMSSWIQSNLKAGYYVTVKGFTVTAYESLAAFDAADGRMFVKSGSAIGALPLADLARHALDGWYANGTAFTKDTVITSDITLSAKWTLTSTEAIYNTAGGSLDNSFFTATITGTNVSRPANSLVLYDKNYAYSATQTNAYGTEVAVDKNGIVISSPAYGTCKTAIPEGGFVLSGIGSGYDWLRASIKVGSYVHLDRENGTVAVYRSYGDYVYSLGKTLNRGEAYGILPTPIREGYVFCGWIDSKGNAVTESSIVKSCDDPTLIATWKAIHTVSFDTNGGASHFANATASGTNISRGSNALIIYKDKATTGTNQYGIEAAIDASGKVIAVYPYGKGNAQIPSGGFVLSGHGTMGDWIKSNLSAGFYVSLSGTSVTVYKSTIDRDSAGNASISFVDGDIITTIPTPTKYGYEFAGWYCNGTQLKAGSAITQSAVYVAEWAPIAITVTLDADGGFFTPAVTHVADGKNTNRGANQLIIFDRSSGKTSTGANVYGFEVVVDAEGIVIELRGYGKGNAPIPEGGFVLSGHGTAEAWLRANVSLGDSIIVSDLEISVYQKSASLPSIQITAYYEKALGALPTPERPGHTFLGWYLSDGTRLSERTPVTFTISGFTLYARWE